MSLFRKFYNNHAQWGDFTEILQPEESFPIRNYVKETGNLLVRYEREIKSGGMKFTGNGKVRELRFSEFDHTSNLNNGSDKNFNSDLPQLSNHFHLKIDTQPNQTGLLMLESSNSDIMTVSQDSFLSSGYGSGSEIASNNGKEDEMMMRNEHLETVANCNLFEIPVLESSRENLEFFGAKIYQQYETCSLPENQTFILASCQMKDKKQGNIDPTKTYLEKSKSTRIYSSKNSVFKSSNSRSLILLAKINSQHVNHIKFAFFEIQSGQNLMIPEGTYFSDAFLAGNFSCLVADGNARNNLHPSKVQNEIQTESSCYLLVTENMQNCQVVPKIV